MITGVLLALLAALVYGFLGVAFEAAAKRNYATWEFVFWKQIWGTLVIFGALLAMGRLHYEPKILLLSVIGAVSYVLTCVCYLTASRERDIAANWTIVNLSVLVPLGVSILWFGDKVTVMKIGGALLTLAAIVMVGGKSNLAGMGRASRWQVFILGAFLLNGVLSALFRWVPEDEALLFVGCFYGVSSLLALPFKLGQKAAVARADRGLLGWSLVGAASHCSGMLLTMAALFTVGKVSAQAGVIVYPITNGFVIPLGVVLGALILKQVIDGRRKLGVALGMAGLVLLSLS
jgi:drug/metabolite transporter (DMT)-like permease